MHARPERGVTLIDLSVALAVVGILASMALPSYQAQLARARRSEAITALTLVQTVQEQFRAVQGSYALQLAALKGIVPRGAHYDLVLAASHPNGYLARAHARGDSGREDGCAVLTLSVLDGVATHGPSERCWNR